MNKKRYLVCDFGASHGRCLVATVHDGKFDMEEVHEFENRPVFFHREYYWDILRLVSEIDIALVKAFSKYQDISSIGVDTWGCDFGFIDKHGRLLSNPKNYRDYWHSDGKMKLDEKIGEYQLFREGGANTTDVMGIYNLYSMKIREAFELQCADSFLSVPDLINYYLTGIAVNEYTAATMTLLLDQSKKCWNKELLEKLGVNLNLFKEIKFPGTVLGTLKKSYCERLNIKPIPVIHVASHDTASAVVGVPVCKGKEWTFISIGTWMLIGQELEELRTDQEAFEAGFANQGGVEGKNNFDTLLTGMWIIQQCVKSWNDENEHKYSWTEITEAASAAPSGRAFIDTQDEVFSSANQNMPNQIRQYCRESGQYVPETIGEIARVIYESLVLVIKEYMDRLQRLTKREPEIIHVFGGGIKNKSLCQWISDATGLVVKAGPVETTSVGNLLMQMKALGDISSVEEGRALSLRSSEIETYLPGNGLKWNEYYIRYAQLKERRKNV